MTALMAFALPALSLAISVGLIALVPEAAFATYPERPVTIVVPFAPGGANDVVVRIIQQPLGEALGQPIIVENRGGAGGNIGFGSRPVRSSSIRASTTRCPTIRSRTSSRSPRSPFSPSPSRCGQIWA
jgi:tripartite-type tricarboxylate transporter receptor subunit TctC